MRIARPSRIHPHNLRLPYALLASIAAGVAVLSLGQIAAKGDSGSATQAVIKNQGYLPYANAPINYRSMQLSDPIAKLEQRLERGEVVLRYEPGHGYLRSVLEALHVPVSSQALVFSKTSFQFPEISPERPRALYYNDDIYVGQVHDGRFLEFISFDPVQGAVFYVMDEHPDEHPAFERAEVDCIQCHVAGSTKGVPGVLLRSVFTRPDGSPEAAARSFVTGQESPFNERWGGWYVTAKSGAPVSMADVTISDPQQPEKLELVPPARLRALPAHLDSKTFLTDSSDIVALLVLAHQTQAHNLITLISYQTRLAMAARKNLDGSPSDTLSDADRQKIEDISEQLVRYLLFTNEVPLENPVAGTSAFAQEFAARGPFDSEGRSLRQFDLHKRIFRYPCSYLVYSDDFASIPEPAKGIIYHRLFEILSGREQGPEFASLSNQDRRAILEILAATKPDLPAEWGEFVRDADQGTQTRTVADAVARHQP
jgi:hypothetical protein